MSFDVATFGQGVATSAANLGLNAVGSVVGGLIDNLFYRRNLDLQTKKQKELIDYQNEYNSPSAQMQRLLEAGLNPNLVYGSQAPAGVSGNSSAPSGHAPESYNTADVGLAMLQAREMQRMDAEKEVLASQAAKNNAEARFTNSQADRYNDLIDQQLHESEARVDKLASEIGVNESSAAYNIAKKNLAVADEEFRRGEISLQTYQRSRIIAETNLFRSQEALNRTKDYYTDMEGQITALELEYQKLFYMPDGSMKDLATAEREALLNEFKKKAAVTAARIGIEGNKSAQWTEWIVSQIGTLLGAGSNAAATVITKRPTPVRRVSGL